MPATTRVHAAQVAWFLRVIEFGDGRWACRHGTLEFDTHSEMQHAIDHIRTLASSRQPAQLFLHRLDGSIEQLEDV